MNNALNAVAMNVEVAQLRAVPGADAGRVAPFAAAAAESHEEVVAMVRALMALARGPLDGACDVGEVAAQVVALLAPGVRARGGSLVLGDDGRSARTRAPAVAVRLAAADLLAETAHVPAREWRCTVTAEPEPCLTLAPAEERAPDYDTNHTIEPALARVGVRPGPVARSFVFPSA